MQVAIKKWGNSAAIRIPSVLLEALQLEVNSEIILEEQDGKIIITPVLGDYDLNELLDGINEDNLHSESSFGKPQGKELL